MVRAFAGLAFLGVWAVSSLFINLGTRADKLIYGRYNDAAIAPLLMIALAEIVRPLEGRRLRTLVTWVGVGGVVLVGSAAFTGLGHPGSEVHGPLNPVNVIAIVPYISHFGGKVEVLALLGVGLLTLAGLAVLALRWPALAIAVLAAGFVALGVANTGHVHRARVAGPRRARTPCRSRSPPSATTASVDLWCVAWDNPPVTTSSCTTPSSSCRISASGPSAARPGRRAGRSWPARTRPSPSGIPGRA